MLVQLLQEGCLCQIYAIIRSLRHKSRDTTVVQLQQRGMFPDFLRLSFLYFNIVLFNGGLCAWSRKE